MKGRITHMRKGGKNPPNKKYQSQIPVSVKMTTTPKDESRLFELFYARWWRSQFAFTVMDANDPSITMRGASQETVKYIAYDVWQASRKAFAEEMVQMLSAIWEEAHDNEFDTGFEEFRKRCIDLIRKRGESI